MRDEVFIIGGGASLKGFDFQKLKDRDTIAVNVAALDVPNPTYSITADSGTFRKVQEGYFKDVNTTWVLVTNPNHATMKWHNGRFKNTKTGYVYNLFCMNMVIRNAGVEGIGFSFNDFRTGYNSGFCAFQLAVLLGYEKIYLLGFDLDKGASKIHYHNKYKQRRSISNDSFDKFLNNFILALGIIKKETSIEVISCSASSKLNSVIPYIPFNELEDVSVQKHFAPLQPEDLRRQKKRAITKIPKPIPMPPPKPIPYVIGDRKLSILICSVKKRELKLRNLLKLLRNQTTHEVEILIEVDNREMTIGDKRNKLLIRARGNYVVFVDDDDKVSDDYVGKILKAISSSPDCCGLEGSIHSEKKKWTRKFIHSVKYKKWFESNKVYYRCPNHLNPVKREIALKVAFPSKSLGEDMNYSMRLLPLLNSEVFINGIIYYYEARG